MPVYAPTPDFAGRRLRPGTLTLIVAGHALVIAAAMTAKMDLPQTVRQITEVELIREPPPPPPPPPPPDPQPRTEPRKAESVIDRPVNIVPIPPTDSEQVDVEPAPLPLPDPGDLIGPKVEPRPQPGPPAKAAPIRVGPRFATPPSRVRPPYPAEKLRTEEEAMLRLRLSIDERGRVTAVESVGPADRAFLEAARRHLIAHWRYRPATQDGEPVPSTTVITLRFELED